MKLLVCAIATCLLSAAIAADITVVGEWNQRFDSDKLSSGGKKVQSCASTATVDICNTENSSWRVLARISEDSWHRSLKLSVRRISVGTGQGAVHGGDSPVTLSTTDTEIFRGAGDRRSIRIETKLSGISVNVRPDAYSCGVIFTVVP